MAEAKPCCWWEISTEGEGNIWDTGCKKVFEFETDGPKQNDFEYCPFCGGEIAIEESK